MCHLASAKSLLQHAFSYEFSPLVHLLRLGPLTASATTPILIKLIVSDHVGAQLDPYLLSEVFFFFFGDWS